MRNLLLFLQLLSGAGLIGAIMLHSAKGEGLGGIGSTARVFGTQKGLEEGLDKLTASMAVMFLAVSIILGVVGAK